MQKIITPENNYWALDEWIGEHKLFVVCDRSLQFLTGIREHLDLLERRGKYIVWFSDFQPNPLYENVSTGINVL